MATADLQRAKTLALAGVFQAASLADSLAWRGHCDPVALDTSLESILILDTDDPVVVFGRETRGLRAGLAALEQACLPPLRNAHPRNGEILRYALALMHIERKLAHSPQLLGLLRRRLEMAAAQRHHFDSLKEPGMLRNLGGIYADTLGTLDFRLQVKGDRKQLQAGGMPEQIRAVLLSGVRAAWLWRRLGGRRWHLMFTRSRVLGDIRRIIKEH